MIVSDDFVLTLQDEINELWILLEKIRECVCPDCRGEVERIMTKTLGDET